MKYTVTTSHKKVIYSGNDLEMARKAMYEHNDSHKRSKATISYNVEEHTAEELEALNVTTYEQIKAKHDVEQAFGEYQPLEVDFADEFIDALRDENFITDTDNL